MENEVLNTIYTEGVNSRCWKMIQSLQKDIYSSTRNKLSISVLSIWKLIIRLLLLIELKGGVERLKYSAQLMLSKS